MTKGTEPLLCEERHGVGYITLDRPQALNALTLEMLNALDWALDQLSRSDSLRCVVLLGSEKSFSVGADLKELEIDEEGCLVLGSDSFVGHLTRSLLRLERHPTPVIAAVRGWALAGGLEIVLCCDIVIAGEGARFGDAHANYGLLPGGGGSARLPRWVGRMRAREMMFTGDSYSAAEMQKAGLVSRVVADADVPETARLLAGKLATRSPTGCAT